MAIEINRDVDSQATAADFAAIAAATEQIATSGRNAEAIFRANAAAAATEIVNLALSSPNDSVRFNAAKYVVERVMGKVPDTKDFDKDGTGAPWEGVYSAIVVHEPSAIERAATAPTSERPRAITPVTGRATPQSYQ